MCTAITFKTKDTYFGRNLDLEYTYNESVTITPRNFPINFKHIGQLSNHLAIIGMAYVVDDYPLYYDAINEKGLGIAGLNFPNNAYYTNHVKNLDNIASFEFIPWVLSQCENVTDAKKFISKLTITTHSFSDNLTPTPLHWLIADKTECIVVEQTKSGLKIYKNLIGILTNNPPFNYQIFSLNNYINISNSEPKNMFSKNFKLKEYSRGMGAIGLPGDLSSSSRFVRATFTKLNSVCDNDELSSVGQFFHILSSVEQQRGCVELENKKHVITTYSSCCNLNRGIYYYTTYENRQINAIDMHKENLNNSRLILYPIINKQNINYIN